MRDGRAVVGALPVGCLFITKLGSHSTWLREKLDQHHNKIWMTDGRVLDHEKANPGFTKQLLDAENYTDFKVIPLDAETSRRLLALLKLKPGTLDLEALLGLEKVR